MISRIAWKEGMFLSPQQFQQADNSVRSYADALAQLDLSGGDFGVSKLEFNSKSLQIGKLAVREAEGVFADRLYFKLDKELVIDIPDGVIDKTVFLAVPIALTGTREFGQVHGQYRFLTSVKQLRDLSDPDNGVVETEVAEVGVTLTLGGTDLSGYTTIPIARILEKTAEGQVILDRTFVPRAIGIAASQVLCTNLDEIIALARVRATNAAARIVSEEKVRSDSSLLKERLELLALNRGLFSLQNMAADRSVSPRLLFAAVGEFLAELDAIQAKFTAPDLVFYPADMGGCFDKVFKSLKNTLTLNKSADVLSYNWNSDLFEKRRLLRLIMPARIIAKKMRPILALSGPDGEARLSQLAPLSCKLAGLSAMPDLVANALPGIELQPLATAPTQLRNRSDATFFAVNTSNPLWLKFGSSHEALALHVDERIQSVDATLYMLN